LSAGTALANDVRLALLWLSVGCWNAPE